VAANRLLEEQHLIVEREQRRMQLLQLILVAWAERPASGTQGTWQLVSDVGAVLFCKQPSYTGITTVPWRATAAVQLDERYY
jgi:hypothetical protein